MPEPARSRIVAITSGKIMPGEPPPIDAPIIAPRKEANGSLWRRIVLAEPVVIANGAALIWWALVLLAPGSTLLSNPAYRGLHDLSAREDVWQGLLLVLLASYLGVRLAPSRWRPAQMMRGPVTLAVLAWWLFLTIAIIAANPTGAGWGGVALLVGNLWDYGRLTRA